MSEDPLTKLIETHAMRYPEAEVPDIYKLLHQATFGPGHLIPNKKAAREFLQQECDQITPAVDVPLIENVHPDGAIVRLHLRPYLAQQKRLNWLLDAFVRSAKEVQGDAATMAQRWGEFEALCTREPALCARFEPHEIALFGRFRASEQWPAVHHSPAFVNAYQPKYRILTRDEAEALCSQMGVAFEVN